MDYVLLPKIEVSLYGQEEDESRPEPQLCVTGRAMLTFELGCSYMPT